MLNLLPDDTKKAYFFAKSNVALRNWIFGFLFALLGLGLLMTYGLLTIKQTTDSYNKNISTVNYQLSKENIGNIKSNVTNISNSLKLAVKVLGSEVLFSKLLTQIGAVMPTGTILTTITVNQVAGGLALNAAATNYQTATQIQVNLSSPNNGVFSKVDIINVQCGGTSTNANYPCSVSLKALFNSNNQFLFINQGNTKK